MEQAIQMSEEKYCRVGAMLKENAQFDTVYEIHEETTEWLLSDTPTVQRILRNHHSRRNW